MSFIYYNANPLRKSHGDCVIRALSKVMGLVMAFIYSIGCNYNKKRAH